MFGGLRLSYRERPVTALTTNRLQALFAYLALHAGLLQSRERLAFLFWPDSTEAQARTNLRQLLHHLRSALPDGGQFITADSQNILWHATPEFVIDVPAFEQAAARGLEAGKAGDSVASRKELEKAATLYGGDFMPGLYDEWVEEERKRLRQKYSDVLGKLILLLEQTGEFSSAIQYAERLLALDRLCETSYQTLMHLHALKGDRAAALLVYHQCVTVLRRELDTEPGPGTRKLRDELTRQDVISANKPDLPARTGATHLVLTGRQRELYQLLGAWKVAEQGRASFVLITGESGIGKTRLLEELRASVSRRGVSTAYARCYAAEGRLAYAPVAEWIRSPVLRSVLSGLPASQLSELVRVLPELLVEHPELRVPPPLSEGWQRHHFFEALARAVLGGPRPLLLLIDDLQWCDQETVEWLHYLLRLEPKTQLLVAGTARIEDLNNHHPLRSLIRELDREGCSIEIPLELLSSKDTAFLAAQVSERRLEPEFVAELYNQTEGNPLFVIESIRAAQITSGEYLSVKTESETAQKAVPLPPKVLSRRTSRLTGRAGNGFPAFSDCD